MTSSLVSDKLEAEGSSVHLAFWLILVAAMLVLGAFALGAYLFAARKLYSRDKQVTSEHRNGSFPEGSP